MAIPPPKGRNPNVRLPDSDRHRPRPKSEGPLQQPHCPLCETFPLETSSADQSVTVCVNLLFTFMIAQAFLSMLCRFKHGIFLFFLGWVVVMSLFVLLFLPETKNVLIEEMSERVWKRHWLWKMFMDGDDYVVKRENGNFDGGDTVKSGGLVGGFDLAFQL